MTVQEGDNEVPLSDSSTWIGDKNVGVCMDAHGKLYGPWLVAQSSRGRRNNSRAKGGYSLSSTVTGPEKHSRDNGGLQEAKRITDSRGTGSRFSVLGDGERSSSSVKKSSVENNNAEAKGGRKQSRERSRHFGRVIVQAWESGPGENGRLLGRTERRKVISVLNQIEMLWLLH